MAHFDTVRPAAASHGIGARFNSFVSGLAHSVVEWNDARVTRKALSRLDDHLLDDLGLSRSDVDRM